MCSTAEHKTGKNPLCIVCCITQKANTFRISHHTSNGIKDVNEYCVMPPVFGQVSKQEQSNVYKLMADRSLAIF